MVYTTEYTSPLGRMTLACGEEAIIGLWFNGQRYFGNILPKQTAQKRASAVRGCKALAGHLFFRARAGLPAAPAL